MRARPFSLTLRVAAMALLLLPRVAMDQAHFSPPAHVLPLRENTTEGVWSEIGGPDGGTGAIYDPVRDRFIVLVGTDVWALPLGAPPVWERLPATGAPEGRSGFEVAYDPVRDRVLIFGGSSGFNYSNEVWALSLSDLSWRQLSPAGPIPEARVGAAWIYDPVGDRMIAFGGLGFPNPPRGPYFNDVWALSLQGEGAWTELQPAGTAPYERPGHGAVYDPVRNRLVVSGGLSQITFDTWALTLSGTPTWTHLAPSGPAPPWRQNYAAVYDPNGDRLVIHGGSNLISGPSGFQSDTWALPLGASGSWTQLANQPPMPSPRSGHVAIYDPIRARMLIYGGSGPGGVPPTFARNEAWALSLTGTAAWSFLFQSARPAQGAAPAGALDSRAERFIVFGGAGSPSGNNDTWAFSLRSTTGWSPLMTAGELPPPRAGAAAIYDPVQNRFVIFGGIGGTDYLNDTWALSLDDPPRWTRLEPSGDPPAARSDHTAVYDPVRNRMIVHGGFAHDFYYDTWALSLTDPPAWTQLSASGPGGPGRSLVHDPVEDRLLVFGGGAHPIYGYPPTNDTWAYPLGVAGAWTQLTPAGTLPPVRGGHTAVYDAGRRRMLVFAGSDASGQSLNDTWELSLKGGLSWRQLSPSGDPPPARARHAAIYDPNGDRMLVFAGTGGFFNFGRNDIWALRFETHTLEVAIDVRPGDSHNAISLHSRGAVPLAVLGATDLDVSTIDLASIRLAGAPIVEAGGRVRSLLNDVNADGFPDLVVHVDAGAMALKAGDTSVEFTGVTQDGTELHGADAVSVVGRGAGNDHTPATPRVEVRYLATGRPVVQLALAESDAPARLEAIAVDGRRVWSMEVPAGSLRPLTIDLDGAQALRAGVYWLRVSQGTTQVAVEKFVWIR